MNTTEIINSACAERGVSKAELAKRMGMLPSSLYRKLARESMTLEELQGCLDALGVSISFELQFPGGGARTSQANHALLLQKLELLEKELEAAKKASEFQEKSLRDLRSELASALGYGELWARHGPGGEEYLSGIRPILSNMDFIITCALGEEPAAQPEPEEPVSFPELMGKRVLLVDDNRMNREILRELLTEHGILVEEAFDGSEAVAKVREQEPAHYDFVLMDLEMPVLDGFEATAQIRKLPNRIRANLPIVALTANAVPESRERAAAVGMDEFFVKPVSIPRLLSGLAKLL